MARAERSKHGGHGGEHTLLIALPVSSVHERIAEGAEDAERELVNPPHLVIPAKAGIQNKNKPHAELVEA